MTWYHGNWIIRQGIYIYIYIIYIQWIEPLQLWLSYLCCRLWPRKVRFTYKLEQWSGFTCTRIPGNWGAAEVRQEETSFQLVQHCMYNVYCIVLCPCTSLISRPSYHPVFITLLQCLYGVKVGSGSWWMTGRPGNEMKCASSSLACILVLVQVIHCVMCVVFHCSFA